MEHFGMIAMPVSVIINNDQGKNVEELINSYNIKEITLMIEIINGDRYKLKVHDIDIKWDQS